MHHRRTDKAGFEQLLQTLDVPTYSISSPICSARVERREPLAVDDLAFARRHTELPIKVTLPGQTRAAFARRLNSVAWRPAIYGARCATDGELTVPGERR